MNNICGNHACLWVRCGYVPILIWDLNEMFICGSKTLFLFSFSSRISRNYLWGGDETSLMLPSILQEHMHVLPVWCCWSKKKKQREKYRNTNQKLQFSFKNKLHTHWENLLNLFSLNFVSKLKYFFRRPTRQEHETLFFFLLR